MFSSCRKFVPTQLFGTPPSQPLPRKNSVDDDDEEEQEELDEHHPLRSPLKTTLTAEDMSSDSDDDFDVFGQSAPLLTPTKEDKETRKQLKAAERNVIRAKAAANLLAMQQKKNQKDINDVTEV